MSEENISVKKLVEEKISVFLDDAKKKNVLDDALLYMAFICVMGEDKEFHFNDKRVLVNLKSNARILGIVNDDSIVSIGIQKDLKDFLLDDNNKFIADNSYNVDKAKIRKSFDRIRWRLKDMLKRQEKLYDELSPVEAIHEQVVGFLEKQGQEHNKEALHYLSILAIKNKFDNDVAGYIKDESLIEKFKKDSEDLGLTTQTGVVVSNAVQKSLRTFFSNQNSSPRVPRYYIPKLEIFFNNIEKTIKELESPDNNSESIPKPDVQLQEYSYIRNFEWRDKKHIKKWQMKSKPAQEGEAEPLADRTELLKRHKNFRDWGRF
jgi:hypothetical protein